MICGEVEKMGEPSVEDRCRRENEIFTLLVCGVLDKDLAAALSFERAMSMRSRGVRLEHNRLDPGCLCQACRPGRVTWSGAGDGWCEAKA